MLKTVRPVVWHWQFFSSLKNRSPKFSLNCLESVQRCTVKDLDYIWNNRRRMTLALLMTLNVLSCISQAFMLNWMLGTSETLQACPCPVLILCFPPQCLCSSSLQYSSFSTPAPGSVLQFCFVCGCTEMNKGKLNIQFAVCCTIYALHSYTVTHYIEDIALLLSIQHHFDLVCAQHTL